jgi:hypothetical protein
MLFATALIAGAAALNLAALGAVPTLAPPELLQPLALLGLLVAVAGLFSLGRLSQRWAAPGGSASTAGRPRAWSPTAPSARSGIRSSLSQGIASTNLAI